MLKTSGSENIIFCKTSNVNILSANFKEKSRHVKVSFIPGKKKNTYFIKIGHFLRYIDLPSRNDFDFFFFFPSLSLKLLMRFILEPSFIHKIFETLKRYARLLEKKGKKKDRKIYIICLLMLDFIVKFIPCRICFDLLSRIELSACVFFPIYDRYKESKRKLDGFFFLLHMQNDRVLQKTKMKNYLVGSW